MPTYYKPWNVATDFSYEELADSLVERLDDDEANANDVGVQGEHTMNNEPWKSKRSLKADE